MTTVSDNPQSVRDIIQSGAVLPAHPLALTARGTIDETHQRALTRYYVDSGAGGIAVGVHTTQFAIRERGMYPEVLQLAADAAREWTERPFALIAGITGRTSQAQDEASIAVSAGYHAGLLNLAAFRGETEASILSHCREIAQQIPLIGFSLLPEVGGLHLSYAFWREFAAIDQVIAIKMAPFNRYRTIDIVRAVVDAHAEGRITLYTGNDDHVVLDLVTPFLVRRDKEAVSVRIKGGLLGHWSVWTSTAVKMLERIHAEAETGSVSDDLLGLDSLVTDSNGAIYDALNDFRGCIPGGLEVLRRQGLVDSTRCLEDRDKLSVGQMAEIDRVIATYPDLADDEFVAQNLERWLSPVPNVVPVA
jgi:hypothetical protein